MDSGGSSIGEAVSRRGDGVVNEEDIFYVPERRPSLDLGPYPMELNPWYWCHSLVCLTGSFHKMLNSQIISLSRISTLFETWVT